MSSCRGLGQRVIEFYLVSQRATKRSPGWRANILRDRPRPPRRHGKHGLAPLLAIIYTPELSRGRRCRGDYSGAPCCSRGSSHGGSPPPHCTKCCFKVADGVSFSAVDVDTKTVHRSEVIRGSFEPCTSACVHPPPSICTVEAKVDWKVESPGKQTCYTFFSLFFYFS